MHIKWLDQAELPEQWEPKDSSVQLPQKSPCTNNDQFFSLWFQNVSNMFHVQSVNPYIYIYIYISNYLSIHLSITFIPQTNLAVLGAWDQLFCLPGSWESWAGAPYAWAVGSSSPPSTTSGTMNFEWWTGDREDYQRAMDEAVPWRNMWWLEPNGSIIPYVDGTWTCVDGCWWFDALMIWDGLIRFDSLMLHSTMLPYHSCWRWCCWYVGIGYLMDWILMVV